MTPTIVGPRQIFSEQLHASKYRLPGESYRDAMSRVAGALQDNKQHYLSSREILLGMRFLPAGRVQSAMGAPKAVTPYNCFVGGTIPDSFVGTDNPEESSIMHRATEGATTMRMGGGLGNDFSTLRPKGARINGIGSQSTGPISFMGIFNAVGDSTSSTGERRGAQMAVLRIDHPDIELFINAKHDNVTLKRFNISVGITDEFMEHLDSGRPFPLRFKGEIHRYVDPEELFEMLMRSTWDWAEPGVIFIDRVNDFNNLYYCERIAATNPCFTGDTMVWTSKGHRSFADLASSGKAVDVLTQDASGKLVYRKMRSPRKTRSMATLVEVTLKTSGGKGKKSEETTFRCTPSHQIFLVGGESKRADELKKNDRIASVYRHLGTQAGYMKLNNEREKVFEHHVATELSSGRRPLWPIEVGHHKDGNKSNNDPDNMELRSRGEHAAEHVRETWEKKGDELKIKLKEAWSDPEVRQAHMAMYTDEERKRRSDVMLGNQRGVKVAPVSVPVAPEAVQNHRVVSVKSLDYAEDVYCGTVEETAKFFIALGDHHGVLVANCAEQPLPPYGACLLGSYNLVQYVRRHTDNTFYFDYDQFGADIPIITRMMDNIVDRAIYPLEQQRLEATNKRRMGLGVTGLANALEACGAPYGSRQFIEAEHKLLAFLTRATYLASADLASEKGTFKLYDQEKFGAGKFVQTLDQDVRERIERDGLRNSHLISYAPTGTISMTADNISSSVEPCYQWRTERPVELPGGTVTVPLYDYAFREWNVRGRRAANGEVSAAQHVDVLVAAQAHCDSAVSKTVNCDGTMPWSDFKGIYVDAYNRGAKGCTTFNKSGKRFGLFKQEDEADDLPFPERGVGEIAHGNPDPESCTFDPSTGRRTCE